MEAEEQYAIIEKHSPASFQQKRHEGMQVKLKAQRIFRRLVSVINPGYMQAHTLPRVLCSQIEDPMLAFGLSSQKQNPAHGRTEDCSGQTQKSMNHGSI